MIVTSPPSFRRTATVTCLCLGTFATIAWLRVPTTTATLRLVNDSHSAFPSLILLGALGGATVFGVACLFRKHTYARVSGLCSLASTIAIFLWFQRFWLYGVFIFGGGEYWVNRAAHSPSDVEATSQLRLVLSASQYGVNTAENAVLAIRDAASQRRLFLLLAACAPNDTWREQYERLAEGWRRRGQPPPR